MKLLLVKTSSLGDVVHALPAVTEALGCVPDLSVDWVVEEAFAPIAKRHPGVRRVIPIAIRRWRKNWPGAASEIRAAMADIRSEKYDLVLDSQGLLKSALLARVAVGTRHGYNRSSARESLSAMFYQHQHDVPDGQHAIRRQKKLMGLALGYSSADSVDFGLTSATVPRHEIVFLHGTTWPSKLWPLKHWQQLASLAVAAEFQLLLPAGDSAEQERATQILGDRPGEVLFRPALDELMDRIAGSAGVVSVDTGLGHLAPAFKRPTVAIFGATDPTLTGIVGNATTTLVGNHLPCIPCRKRHCQYEKTSDSSSIYPPCYSETLPEAVWQALRLRIGNQSTVND